MLRTGKNPQGRSSKGGGSWDSGVINLRRTERNWEGKRDNLIGFDECVESRKGSKEEETSHSNSQQSREVEGERGEYPLKGYLFIGLVKTASQRRRKDKGWGLL